MTPASYIISAANKYFRPSHGINNQLLWSGQCNNAYTASRRTMDIYMQDLPWEDIFSSPSVTHSQNLQDLIRVAGDKVLTGPTETFIHSKVHTAVSSPFSNSSCFIFILHHHPVSTNSSVILLRHSAAPSYFNLSSHSLYKYLSVSLAPPPLLFLKRAGESSIPCGCEHPLKVRSAAAPGANRPGFHTGPRHLSSPQH